MTLHNTHDTFRYPKNGITDTQNEYIISNLVGFPKSARLSTESPSLPGGSPGGYFRFGIHMLNRQFVVKHLNIYVLQIIKSNILLVGSNN